MGVLSFTWYNQKGCLQFNAKFANIFSLNYTVTFRFPFGKFLNCDFRVEKSVFVYKFLHFTFVWNLLSPSFNCLSMNADCWVKHFTIKVPQFQSYAIEILLTRLNKGIVWNCKRDKKSIKYRRRVWDRSKSRICFLNDITSLSWKVHLPINYSEFNQLLIEDCISLINTGKSFYVLVNTIHLDCSVHHLMERVCLLFIHLLNLHRFYLLYLDPDLVLLNVCNTSFKVTYALHSNYQYS